MTKGPVLGRNLLIWPVLSFTESLGSRGEQRGEGGRNQALPCIFENKSWFRLQKVPHVSRNPNDRQNS